MKPIRISMLMLVAGCVAAVGCGGRELPETVNVTGKIMFEGKAVDNAEVGFVPTTEEKGTFAARGRTDSEGQFELMTYFGPDDDVSGALPGDYIVTVTKPDVPADPAELQKHFQAHPQMVPKNLLPQKYISAKTSDLKAPVTADGDNNFEFELTGSTAPDKKAKK